MKIQVGDMFRIKATGEILEITGDWFNSEYRYNSYSPDGIPSCGANGHHNISGNIERWYKSGGLEKIKPLPSEPYMIKTYDFCVYEHKRLITDKIEVIEENINDKPAKKVEKCDLTRE